MAREYLPTLRAARKFFVVNRFFIVDIAPGTHALTSIDIGAEMNLNRAVPRFMRHDTDGCEINDECHMTRTVVTVGLSVHSTALVFSNPNKAMT